MRLPIGLTLLLAAGFSISAHADTSVVVTDSTGPLFSASFTVNQNDYTVVGVGEYSYMDKLAMVNGAPDSLTINVGLSSDGDTLNLTDSGGLNEYFDVLTNPALFFDPGPPVVFNQGMFSATDETCAVLGLDCASTDATVVATNITPEPSTLALFGTGVLGMVGVIRRRVQA